MSRQLRAGHFFPPLNASQEATSETIKNIKKGQQEAQPGAPQKLNLKTSRKLFKPSEAKKKAAGIKISSIDNSIRREVNVIPKSCPTAACSNRRRCWS